MVRARASVLLRNQLTQLSESIYIYIYVTLNFLFLFFRDQESKFFEKLQTLQHSLETEREKDLLNASQHRSQLEDSLLSTKSEEHRLKVKLSEAEEVSTPASCYLLYLSSLSLISLCKRCGTKTGGQTVIAVITVEPAVQRFPCESA